MVPRAVKTPNSARSTPPQEALASAFDHPGRAEELLLVVRSRDAEDLRRDLLSLGLAALPAEPDSFGEQALGCVSKKHARDAATAGGGHNQQVNIQLFNGT